jgi:hypothetical protein
MSCKILQINVNRNSITTENILQMAIELNIKILAIQEPWVISNNSNEFRSINHPSFKQLFPNYSTFRPRVLFYISREYTVNLASISPLDPDCIIIDLIDQNIQLINIYNASHPNIENSIATIQRENLLPELLARNTIILGDFNTHHPWWDPLNTQSANSVYLMDIINKYSLNLLNTPGEGTFYRPHMAIPSTIDLTFATQGIVNKIIDWQVMPDLGSDHYGVLFTILYNSSTLSSSIPFRFNTKKANWVLFKENLDIEFKNFTFKDPNYMYSNQELDNLTELFTSKIIKVANSSIPKSKILLNAKPWWNEELKILRKSMLRFSRKFKASGYLSNIIKKKLLDAKNLYFNTIKIEKQKHWNQFLEKECKLGISQREK